MAGNIKGIIVEIGGDTSGLQKALSKVNSATASLSKELKGINSLLKLDPKNTELLNQKQNVLNQSISTTEDKLKQLQKIKEEADRKMADGTEINEENYRALQREIINTQNKLSNLKNEASNWTKAGNALIGWGENLNKISEKIDSLGSKLTTKLTLPITAAATAGITYDAQIEKYETAFKTFLGSAEKAGEAIKNIKDDAKRTPFDTTSLVKANQMLISTGVDADKAREDILALGEAIVATGGGNDELTRMASNLQQIKNAGKATAMDIRQFAYAGIDVYGILADYLGKTTEEIKDMEISYDDLTKALKKASSQGGKYFGAMSNSSETLTGQVSALKSEVQDGIGDLTKSLMPTAKKVVEKGRDIIKQFDKLSDSQKENIVKIGLMVAAAGPLLKVGSSAIGIIGNVSKGLGTFSKAVSLAHNGIGTATGSAATLAKVLQGLTSPAGLAAVGITAAVGIIVAQIAKAKKEIEDMKDSFSNIGDGMSNMITDIENASSRLGNFSLDLFATKEEQSQISQRMQEIQDKITEITSIASEERRKLTEEEIKKIDEYFAELDALSERQLEIERARADALIVQAQLDKEQFKGSTEEYKQLMQEWSKTAQDQANEEIEIIKQKTIDKITILNQEYGDIVALNEQEKAEWQAKVDKIYEEQQKEIDHANETTSKIYSIYSEGYTKQTIQNQDWYKTYSEHHKQLEEEEDRYIQEVEKGHSSLWGALTQNVYELETYEDKVSKMWKNFTKNLDEEQENQMGNWLQYIIETEARGGELDDETQKIVNTIIEDFEKMPEDSKGIMKDTMQGMFNGMQEKEPDLYAKADGISGGILSRLRKAFDVHSPSRETKKIFKNVMLGGIEGIEDEEANIYSSIDEVANGIKNRLSNIDISNMNIPKIQDFGKLQSSLSNQIIDSTRTVFTTPQIVFNVQELDEAKLQQCFNYVNRKFGSQY